MSIRFGRRGLFARASSALAWDPARAQSPGGVLRVGMTANAVDDLLMQLLQQPTLRFRIELGVDAIHPISLGG